MGAISRAELRGRNGRDWQAFLVVWVVLLVAFEGAGVLMMRKLPGYDFRTFYTAGYLLRTRPAELYSWTQQQWVMDHLIAPGRTPPYVSPAYGAILFAPLSAMTYGHAYLCFMLINFAVLLAAFWIARDTFAATIPFVQPRPGLMLLVFFPLLVALLHGQLSVMLLLACSATWTALKRGHVGLAGLILASAICKFNLILPIAFVLALRWRWRFVVGFATGTYAALAVSLLLVGQHGMAMLLDMLRADTLLKNDGAAAQAAMTAFPMGMLNLYALVYAAVHRLQRPGLTFGLTMAVSLVAVAGCAWLARRDRRDEAVFSVAVLCGLLVSYHMYMHDLTLLLLPLILLQGIRHYEKLVVASYVLPCAILLLFGANGQFLIALIPLWAVWLVWRSQPAEGRAGRRLRPTAASTPIGSA